MATAARTAVRPPLARGPATRMVEWGILAAMILVVVAVAGQYVRVLRAQAERSAVLSTLGALRTGLVIAHLRGASTAYTVSSGGPPQSNPFTELQTLPLNYRGELSVSESLAMPTGGWVYDPQCVCVGYIPLDAGWSDGASQAGALWFKVVSGPGPRQLTAQDAYTWRGTVVK